jgi:DNA-binding GntR family transcriptional regulator
MVRKVVEVPLVYRSVLWYSDEQRLISGHYHRQIASALEARNTERAESIMKAHVHEARDFLVAEAAKSLPEPQQEER